MPTNVVMPQMGESVAEGTIVRWLKQVGETGRTRRAAVRDLHRQGGRGDPVALLRRPDRDQGEGRGDGAGRGRGGRDCEEAAAAPPPQPAPAPVTPPSGPLRAVGTVSPAPARGADPRAAAPTCRRRIRRPVRTAVTSDAAPRAPLVAAGSEDRARPRDRHLHHRRHRPRWSGDQAGHPRTRRTRRRPSDGRARRTAAGRRRAGARQPVFRPGEAVEVVPMTVMRKRIAEHMIMSRRTSAHVHSIFEIDFHAVAAIRSAKKADYEKLGRQADLSAVHHQGRVRRPAGSARGQLLDRRRLHRLQEGHQHRYCRCPRLGPDRPGHQAGRRVEPPGAEPRRRRPARRGRGPSS